MSDELDSLARRCERAIRKSELVLAQVNDFEPRSPLRRTVEQWVYGGA